MMPLYSVFSQSSTSKAPTRTAPPFSPSSASLLLALILLDRYSPAIVAAAPAAVGDLLLSCMAMGGFAIADASVPGGQSRAKAKAAAEKCRSDGLGPTSTISLLDDLAWRRGRGNELRPPLEVMNSGRARERAVSAAVFCLCTHDARTKSRGGEKENLRSLPPENCEASPSSPQFTFGFGVLVEGSSATPSSMEESKTAGAKVGESEAQEMTEQQIIGTYRGMLGDVNQMRRKISELEQEVSEHQ